MRIRGRPSASQASLTRSMRRAARKAPAQARRTWSGSLNRGIPESHDTIADELIDGASFLRDRPRNFLEIG